MSDINEVKQEDTVNTNQEQKTSAEEVVTLSKQEVEELRGLKSHIETVLEEKRQEKEKRQAAAAAKEEAELKKAEAEGNASYFKQKLEDAMRQLSEKDKAIAERDARDAEYKHNEEAKRIAKELTKDVGRQEVLARLVKDRITVDGETVTVLDRSGKATISTVDELLQDLKKNYEFLIDGVSSSGGNSHGSGSVPGNKPYSEMSEVEKVQLKRTNESLWRQLSGH